MYTAANIMKNVEKNRTCPGIDAWIAEILEPKFIKSNGAPVNIASNAIESRGWLEVCFIEQMSLRGFDAKYNWPEYDANARVYVDISIKGPF